MNWKRGLLRLWAVAAVLWVSVAFYSNDTVQRVRDAYAMAHDWDVISDRPIYAHGRQLTDEEVLAIAKAKLQQRHVQVVSDHALTPELKVIKEEFQAYRASHSSIWPPLFDFAKLAFIPPLLLLALGYIGLWVGRGFRR
jgi:hypothetical protein